MQVIAAAAGLVADELFGEPAPRWHPVVWFGTAMGRLERKWYADRRSNGLAFTAVGIAIGAGTGLVLRRLVGRRVATVVATGVCVAGRMLDHEASEIAGLVVNDDLVAARQRLRSLVGRATEQLDEAEISRAVIESVAENCVDAVTASLFWATLGGAPAVFAHRAVNTLDAMVGHHTVRYERFGWASARLDDVVNYVPARLTALAIAAARPAAATRIWQVVRRDARQHPSPNGGVVEAAFAAALGVRLGGTNRYGETVEDRGTLGTGPAPTPAAVTQAVQLRRHATGMCVVVLAAAVPALRTVMLRGCLVGGERLAQHFGDLARAGAFAESDHPADRT